MKFYVEVAESICDKENTSVAHWQLLVGSIVNPRSESPPLV